MRISGYAVEFNHPGQKRQGGVGFYLKESFEYKVPKDIFSIDSTTELLCFEMKDKNKNRDLFVELVYHTIPENKEK